MMKPCLFLILLLASFSTSSAAQDTTAYEIQRAKINRLLAERSAKFGQYDQSLNERTGIFGLQTKHDIRNSNEILRQIAITDNDIFRELKVLLDYKDLLVEQAKTTATTTTESIVNYRKTIKDLQTQNEQLTKDIKKLESSNVIAHSFMFIFLIGNVILAYYLNIKRKKLKRYEKTGI